MLIRVVHMHFTEEGVERFLKLFHEHGSSIRNMPGCSHLELLKDVDDSLHYMTISHWDNEDNLQMYRQSALFRIVWGDVKTLFSQRSRAYSMERLIVPKALPG